MGVNEDKKIIRKQKKSQQVVMSETGVVCVSEPTKNLAICNVGLANGLTEETVIEHFTKHGTIDNLILLPGKSCSFISYTQKQSAVDAFSEFNGKLCIAQNNKPIYLSYIETVPKVQLSKTWKENPPGLILLKDFISESEEERLLALCDFTELTTNESQMKHRQVRHFGYEFRYDINNVDKDKPLPERVPSDCNFLWERLNELRVLPEHFMPDQLTVNYYAPGQGIPPHVDTHSAFYSPIISLSLLSSVIMEFKKENMHNCVLLPQRSLAIMYEESRYDWTHGITPRKLDVIHTDGGYTTQKRSFRISFTFRKVRQGECNCSFPKMCDSQRDKSPVEERPISTAGTTASQLEQMYVHDVYNNIAEHFSETRHKPWPNVLKFVTGFKTGEVLLDIGCGNGKNLGHNRAVFEMGCDASDGLLELCNSRGLDVFTANCLNLPFRDNCADGAISIAVIHHLVNQVRRIQAVKEMVRILRVNGQALIYVWAKDQNRASQKSSYLKQNTKKSDESTENFNSESITSTTGVTLPVHTNRTQFKHSNLLVPWKLKSKSSPSTENMFLRFYHVFEEDELVNLCKRLENIEVLHSYYDQGNWCVIIRKTAT